MKMKDEVMGRNIARIQEVAAEYFGKDLQVMRGTVRTAEAAWARQVGMFLARRLTLASSTVVARGFGKRDHGTTLHAVRAVRERCEVCLADREAVAHLEVKIRGLLEVEAAPAPPVSQVKPIQKVRKARKICEVKPVAKVAEPVVVMEPELETGTPGWGSLSILEKRLREVAA
jgi:hypothetical protein